MGPPSHGYACDCLGVNFGVWATKCHGWSSYPLWNAIIHIHVCMISMESVSVWGPYLDTMLWMVGIWRSPLTWKSLAALPPRPRPWLVSTIHFDDHGILHAIRVIILWTFGQLPFLCADESLFGLLLRVVRRQSLSTAREIWMVWGCVQALLCNIKMRQQGRLLLLLHTLSMLLSWQCHMTHLSRW